MRVSTCQLTMSKPKDKISWFFFTCLTKLKFKPNAQSVLHTAVSNGPETHAFSWMCIKLFPGENIKWPLLPLLSLLLLLLLLSVCWAHQESKLPTWVKLLSKASILASVSKYCNQQNKTCFLLHLLNVLGNQSRLVPDNNFHPSPRITYKYETKLKKVP
jgi:hypothetical protein